VSSVFFRGPKAAPRWYARYLDTSGVWRAKRVRVETRGDATKIARQLEAQAERRRYGLEAPESAGLLMREVLEKFRLSLTNRSWRDDAGRLRLHVVPRWGSLRVDQVTLPAIMAWLDEMRAEAKIAPGTQRHALGLLSRAFSWAVARGLAASNPCRLIPPGARPQAAPARDGAAWIADDETPLRLMELLPEPFNLAFYVAFTSGCRMGEAFGLHLDDLDELAAGCLRVARSFGGPLKEDKKGTGLVKFVPAAADAVDVLGPWLVCRRAAGAGPEDLLFPGADGKVMPRYLVAYQWRKAAKALGLNVSWHKATRTSAASRWAARGVDIGQIAAALGHHGTEIAIRHYQKWVRKTFDPRMTRALAAPGAGGTVIAMPVSTSGPAAAAGANDSRPGRTEDKDAA
jgi:integrase